MSNPGRLGPDRLAACVCCGVVVLLEALTDEIVPERKLDEGPKVFVGKFCPYCLGSRGAKVSEYREVIR